MLPLKDDMIFLIGAYLLLQLAVGYWVSQRIKSTRDYFVADKSLPLPLVAVSLVATWFGAETCIGSSGAVYSFGLSGSRADPFGYSACLFLTGLLIAVPMWNGGYITIGDFYRRRFGSVSEKLTVLILVPGSLFWGGAQLRAFGQIISHTTQLPVDSTLIFCTLFVLVYTYQGGLLGDVINDFIQGLVIVAGLVTLLIYTVYMSDFSFSNWYQNVSPERLSFLSSNETFWARIDRWAIPIFGSLITQELLARTISAKSPTVARKACYWACGLYLIIGSIPVILGLIGPELLPQVTDSEHFLPALANRYLPPAMHVLFIGGIVAALLSTIDSILLSASALTTQNILHKYVDNASKSKQLFIARTLVIVSALTCYTIAVTSDGIYELVEMASAFGTAGLFVVTLFGLWSKWGGAWAANMGLVSGAFSYHVGDQVLGLEAPFVSAIIVAFLGYLLGFVLEKRVIKSTLLTNVDIPVTHQ